MTRWDEAAVREWVSRTDFREYQQVELPYGITIPGRDRSATARVIFDPPPTGKRYLDIGCDYGYFLNEAIRLGAASATGIEMRPERAEIARTIAEIKASPIAIHTGSLEEAEIEGPFEWVSVLNVLHHVRDPLAFMKKVAEITTERVIVEFPLLSQDRFRSATGISKFVLRHLDSLPVIGVRTDEKLGFFFTQKSFEMTFIKQLGLFQRIRFVKSPSFPDRLIAFCER